VFYGHFGTVATCGGDGEDRDPSRERTRVQELDIQMTGLVMNRLTSHGECNGRFDGASPGGIMKKVYLLIAALTALVLAPVPAPVSAATTTSTVVIHGQTFTEFFPDDICGPRASYVTFTFRTEVTLITELADGSFTFQDMSTGTYHVDFLDPALADQDSQFAGPTHVTLAPSGTFVFSVAFHDFSTGLRIWQRLHLTVVDGRPVVDRDILKVTGCP
jgi:hypothetical protein